MIRKIQNKIYQYTVTGILMLLILCSQTINAQSSLDEYLKLAAENNPELKSAFLEYRAAMERVPQIALPDPMFNYSYFIMPVETRTGARVMDFGLSQQFPWFGTLDAKEDKAAQLANAKWEQAQVKKYALFYRIKTAWYQLYLVDEQIELLRKNINILQSFDRLALVQFEAGRGSMANVLKVQIDREELENDLQNMQDMRQLLQERINLMLNRELGATVLTADTLTPQNMPYSLQIIRDSVLTQNPQIKNLIYQQSAAAIQQNIARKEGMPDFMLGVTYGIMEPYELSELEDNGRDMLMPMISISIPINRKKYNAMRQEAIFEQQALQQMQVSKENELSLMLQEAYYDYLNAQRKIKLYQIQLRTLKQTQDLQVTAFSAEGQDFEEVLRIQRQLYNYQNELIQAIVANNIAIAEMEMLIAKDI